MRIIGIDPGISGAICFFQDGKVVDIIDMPSMAEGKKNKKAIQHLRFPCSPLPKY